MDMHNAAIARSKSDGWGTLRAILAAGVQFIIHLTVTMLIVVFLGSVVRQYSLFYEANGVMLPVVTRQLLQLSLWNNSYWYLLVLAFIAVDGLVAVGLQFLPDRLRWLKACWFDGYLVAAIVFLFWGIVALSVPIHGMVQATGR